MQKSRFEKSNSDDHARVLLGLIGFEEDGNVGVLTKCGGV